MALVWRLIIIGGVGIAVIMFLITRKRKRFVITGIAGEYIPMGTMVVRHADGKFYKATEEKEQ